MSKRKFRTSEEAQKAREAAASWEDLQKRWGVTHEAKKRNRAMTAKPYIVPASMYRGSDEPKAPSLNTGWYPCTKKPDRVYTGDKMLGVSTLHKSNAVPVFSDEAIKDISKMRR